jgi:hypothetical protein
MNRLMNRLATGLVAAAALWLAACGGSGSSVQPPPPAGNFTLASLNGTYAFMTSGEVFTSNSLTATPMSRVGSFIADGKGGISGGIEDVNSAGTPSGATTITGGSYTINADGRGTLTLNFQSGNSINFGIALTSGSSGSSPASDGLMIDETSSATQSSTGSGNFILQNTAVCSSPVGSVAGTYVFDFSGLDSSGFPESFIGEFTANNSGATTANFGDLNDDFNISSGSFTASLGTDGLNPAGPNACGRGLAQIVTGTTSETYAYYVVDSNRIRFINSAGGEMLSGDAVLQPTAPASPSGGFALIVAGASGNGGVTRVGRFSVSGSSVNNVLLDTNNSGMFHLTGGSGGGSVSNATITMDPANPGRGMVTFTDSMLSVPFTFVFYLSSATSGVIQEQSQSTANGPADVADGSILAQTGTFSSSTISGAYGLNWSGLSVQNGSGFATQDEEDFLGQASLSGLNLTGTADIFQFTNGAPRTDFGLGGSITLGGDGTGSSAMRNTMTINLNGAAPINFVVYFASPQLAFFANSNNSGTQRIVAGVLKAQQ